MPYYTEKNAKTKTSYKKRTIPIIKKGQIENS